MSSKRIGKELRALQNAASEEYHAEPSGTDDYQWTATISGPESSPYHEGLFFLSIHFPKDYPFKPPKVKFDTKIYHCNVDDSGGICLPMLKDEWSPSLTVGKVLSAIHSLLQSPNLASPLKADIAQQYNDNKELHDSTAKEWTAKFAQ